MCFKWFANFKDIEKIKYLNALIKTKGGKRRKEFKFTPKEYKAYIERFYYEKQFNDIYNKWKESDGERLLKPSLDHITPTSKGGADDLSNLQMLPLFENYSKGAMTQEEWDKMKSHIRDYLI